MQSVLPACVALVPATVAACAAQVAGVRLPPMTQGEAQHAQIIANGGFEDPESQAWRFSDWPPRPDTGARLIAKSVFYSRERVHTGDWALCIDLTTVEEDRHLLAQQSFGLEKLAPYDGRRVRMSAWIWVEQGPPGCQGTLSMRQWGPPGAPPIGHASVRLDGTVGEWMQGSTEFTLHVGETTRGDITVGMRQVADPTTAPVVYVDDVRLEAMTEPPLAARLLHGTTLFPPDRVLPIAVVMSEQAWADGLRSLRWNITSPDGLRSHSEGDAQPASRRTALEVPVPALPEGRYAVRLALGVAAGERRHELLLPFRRAEGPFAR
ncbi:MAG: hypothetical protein ACE5R4_08400 [Armatimonadota bacterium]